MTTMPSLLHEGLLEIVRDQPELAATLLKDLLDIPVPAFTQARMAEAELPELVPIEYRADAVVGTSSGGPLERPHERHSKCCPISNRS